MNLIGTDHYIVPQADFRYTLKFFFSEDSPHRIVRVTEDKKTGLVGYGFFKAVVIDAVAAVLHSGQFHFLALQSGVGRS